MKHLIYLLALAFAVAANAAPAATFPRNQVSSEAKWLLHLDLQNFRQTQLGEFVTKNVIEKFSRELDEKIGIDVAALVQRISRVTAYGTEFAKHPEASGVLLVQMDGEAQKILEGVLAAQILADGKGALKKLPQGDAVAYSLNDDLFLSIQPKNLVLLGKSQTHIDKARDVLAGKAPSLVSSDPFSGYPAAPDAFFFLAVAEGFNENRAIPPQARVLQEAEGGRIIVGEKAAKLFVDLSLKSKSPEVSQEIQQVIEGLRALVSLSQAENQEWHELVRSIKVSASGKLVTVKAEFPLESAMKTMAGHFPDKRSGKGRPGKPKNESKSKSDGEESVPKKID